MKNEQFTFLDFLTLLTKWRKQIFFNLLIVAVISITISLFLPKWFKSTAIVMPPQQSNSTSGLSSMLSGLPLSSFGINLGGGSELTYMAILKSKSLAINVIERYDLQQFYEKPTMEETFLSFYSDYEVLLTEENMISISYEYTDSNMVAEIVNYMIDYLGQKSNQLILERSERTFNLIQKRYFENLHDIDSLKIALENFQNRYGVIEFVEQTKAIIAAVVDFEAQILLKQAELDAVKTNYGEGSPQYNSIKIQIDSFKKQVDVLKSANMQYLENPFSSMFIPIEKIPELGKKYTDIYTNLLLQQKLQEYLLPEYEQAKMQLMKEKPAIQVIDYAVPPDYKSKPKRAFIVLGAIAIAFIIQLFLILLFRKIEFIRLNEPEKYKKVEYIFAALSFRKEKK
ncbi:MAG: hypothetical protein K9J16_06955 [Melioribacteraceae bacterium]|nr:hypothetical protein [Melioribacteraceae bacterium]MCF8354532.1 hypothetical protein [Melioribacteraceae bacterium]MCF8394301.1 hypothetical protein [Melioribacteraceae bacterium]MCF8418201.1 hypothetical protein [Melioribacteraceae bacterium]